VFNVGEIAKHIHSFIAAKKLAEATGRPDEITLHVEAKDKSSGFYLNSDDHASVVAAEQKVMKMVESVPSDQPYSYMSFISERAMVSTTNKHLHVGVFDTPKYAIGEKDAEIRMEADLHKIATSTFLRKPAAMRQRYFEVISASIGKLSPIFKEFPVYRDGTTPIMMCFKRGESRLSQIFELLKHLNLSAKRKFIECFSNGLVVYSVYLHPCPKESVNDFFNQLSLTSLVPRTQLTDLFFSGNVSAEEYAFSTAASFFIYYFTSQKSEEYEALTKTFASDPVSLGRLKSLQTKLKREAVSRKRVIESVINNLTLVKDICHVFENKCSKKITPEQASAAYASLLQRIPKEVKGNDVDLLVLRGLVTFTEAVVKTNFFASKKSALSFRLTPQFLAGTGIVPDVPFGLFLVMSNEFHGFHVRFDDIARGGIRMIRSASDQIYTQNFETVFNENYNLAHTQAKKNKDIPEGGSKGTILLSRQHNNMAQLAFQKYIAGLVDLLVDKPGGFDGYGKEELLFLGPDEGTADYMAMAALYARMRGYKYWRAFTTGKPPALGGIPHDLFGMTTRSVRRYVMGSLAKLGLTEDKITKVQTGGPDGDLGSNEILLSKERTTVIVDGSGVVYDPNGLNRDELVRLAKARLMVGSFSRSLLSPQGFLVLINDRDVKLPHGEIVENGRAFRDSFHLHPLAKADLFVPCGGRPEAVNMSNVDKLFDDNGKPKFRIIVEGANLFITQDARLVLEKAGVILYKDASANKGGVTSSSMEVLAALALTEEEFEKNMAVHGKEFPPFYKAYVEEIQRKIEYNADMEFECIWREHLRTGTPRAILTDTVSAKINTLNNSIQGSSLWDNVALRRRVLSEAVPLPLQKLVGIDAVMSRLPPAYAKAIFGAHLACQFVYSRGVSADEFAFYEFMQAYLAKN
jgi:glutamate dehydrogenase